jgi:hypothetical protein
MPVVIAELELGKIEMEILFAHLLERADAAAFEPKVSPG